MKKIFYLFSATIVIISAIFMSGYLITKNTADIYVYTLSEKDVDNVVNAQGKLQYGTEKNVKAECDSIIGEIYVSDGDNVNKGDMLFTYHEVEQYSENVDISEYYGKTEISSIASIINDNSSEIEELKESYKTKIMYAKTDGIISGISVSDGEYVEKNKDILKVTDKSSLEIPININETSVSKIKLNQKANITFAATEDKTFTGTISNIAEEAKQTTGLTGKETTVEVTIAMDDNAEELRVGYSASCSIITSTEHNVLIAPYECVRSDNEGEYVYLVSENKAKKIYIKTGTEYKEGILVKSGLKKGDILIENCDSIYDGQTVNIIDRENNQ